jgi:hypothetical protein
MYLRHTTRVKDGKTHTYWRLVRSVRMGRKVVQQTVAHLGELDAGGRARAKALARTITGEREQADLFIPDPAPTAPVPIRLDRVRVERGRTFGDVWLAWTLWRALRLDTVLDQLLPPGRDRPSWWTTSVAPSCLERPAYGSVSVQSAGARPHWTRQTHGFSAAADSPCPRFFACLPLRMRR